ncbi:MAG: hypothetical protein DRQ35_02955 [Gammaproteobacteria bacterium]|nr:MAG: hypothetical protein DRQ35_02955 [Gammaproteobacteria bacterium]
MKNKILTMAVISAMLSGTAVAAGPTLYGKIHTSVDVMDNGGSGDSKYQETSLNSNASRIGIKGSEDIGDGMRVGYLIEWQVDMTGDGGDMAIRNRAVTLNGEFGTFLAGKWDSPMKTLGRKVDLFGDQVGDLRNMTSLNSGIGGVGSVSLTTIDQRWDNVIQYRTPDMNGLNGTVAYSFDTNTDGVSTGIDNSGDNQDNDAYSFNVMYDRDAYMVGLGYEHTDSNGINSTWSEDQKAWRLAASYDITPNLDILASYTDINNFGFNKDLDTEVATLGTSYSLGNNKLKLQYAVRDDFNGYSDTGSKMITVGADHNMSKRTTIYAAYSRMDNDDMSGNTPWLASHDTSALGSFGDDADVLSLGIVHKF